MTKQPDASTTLGRETGCCGHRTVREAGRCADDHHRRDFSDRRVVAIAADAPWPPAGGCDLKALSSGRSTRTLDDVARRLPVREVGRPAARGGAARRREQADAGSQGPDSPGGRLAVPGGG